MISGVTRPFPVLVPFCRPAPPGDPKWMASKPSNHMDKKP